MSAVSQMRLLGASSKTVTNLGNTGTSFGDLTAGGGLAAAFDGVTSQAAASGARKTASTRSYIGKNYSGGSPSAYPIDRVTYYTSSDQGLSSNGAVSCTVQLRGMHTAPSSTPAHECRHICGNGHLGCVTPSHLEWGTHAENMADAVAHGTVRNNPRYGKDHHDFRATDEVVEKILSDLGLGMTQYEVAAKYGFGQSHISRIKNGWRRNKDGDKLLLAG